MHKLVQYFESLYIYVGMRIYMSLKVFILPTLKLIFVQAVLNTVLYQMLIVYTNVLVNSAVQKEFMQFVTPLLNHVDTGLQELHLPLLVMGIHCTM